MTLLLSQLSVVHIVIGETPRPLASQSDLEDRLQWEKVNSLAFLSFVLTSPSMSFVISSPFVESLLL